MSGDGTALVLGVLALVLVLAGVVYAVSVYVLDDDDLPDWHD